MGFAKNAVTLQHSFRAFGGQMKSMFACMETAAGKMQDLVVDCLRHLFTSFHCAGRSWQYDVEAVCRALKASPVNFFSKASIEKHRSDLIKISEEP